MAAAFVAVVLLATWPIVYRLGFVRGHIHGMAERKPSKVSYIVRPATRTFTVPVGGSPLPEARAADFKIGTETVKR